MLVRDGVPVANTTPPLHHSTTGRDAPSKYHIERPFARRLRQSRDACHFRNVEQVFEIVRLVHQQPVHAKFLQRSACCLFFMLGSQRLKFGFKPLLGFFKFLHQTAIGTVRVFPPDHFQLVKLLLEKPFPGVSRESGMRFKTRSA